MPKTLVDSTPSLLISKNSINSHFLQINLNDKLITNLTLNYYNPIIDINPAAFTQNSFVRVFGKPQSHEGRRMAVALTFDKQSSQVALEKAKELIKEFSDK